MHSDNYSKLDETELLELARSNNQAAFSEIIRRFKDKIAGTVYGMLGKNMESEDICQEVFIRFFNKIDNFRGESSLGTYLTRIAINLSLNEIKKRARHSFFDLDRLFEKNRNNFSEESEIHSIEKKEIVEFALQKLETKFRSVIVLRLIDGYSTEETAKILKIPAGTVLSRLSRAQQKLKIILTPLMGD